MSLSSLLSRFLSPSSLAGVGQRFASAGVGGALARVAAQRTPSTASGLSSLLPGRMLRQGTGLAATRPVSSPAGLSGWRGVASWHSAGGGGRAAGQPAPLQQQQLVRLRSAPLGHPWHQHHHPQQQLLQQQHLMLHQQQQQQQQRNLAQAAWTAQRLRWAAVRCGSSLNPALPSPGEAGQDQQQQQQQQRLFSKQPAWWQIWQHPSSSKEEQQPAAQQQHAPGGSSSSTQAARSAASAAAGEHAVDVAVAVNIIIFIAKLATWQVTSSGALLAEAMHSMADIANQLLLKLGLRRSKRAPTQQHQYGFYKEKYVFALISAVGIFCLGSGASVLHGFQAIMDPPALENMGLSLKVLLFSAVLESYSLGVALRHISGQAREAGVSVLAYVMRGRDPTTSAVLMEDGGAVMGLAVAALATGAVFVTGNPLWDGVGSIAVGALMGLIATTLIRNNRRFLIGQAMPPEMESGIVAHLQRDPMVKGVIDPKSEEMGDGIYRFKAEIQWSGEHVVQKYLGSLGRESVYTQIKRAACASGIDDDTLQNAMDVAMMDFGQGVIRTVGEEIDRLEIELKCINPGLRYVDLETDRGRMDAAGSMLESVDLADLWAKDGVGAPHAEQLTRQPTGEAADSPDAATIRTPQQPQAQPG